ncbi:MAG: hypothetical protein KJO08_04010 [Gammaproteobacteria bacterium]|nr:hypothetical protein [Gammaproteobacteria bacterium]
MSHDQNFKNLILDYPRAALEFFAPQEAACIPEATKITPVRQEQLKSRLGDRFRELDTPLLVEFPEGKTEAVLFILEEETSTKHFSIHKLIHYCVDLADLLNMNRVVPVVIFLRPGHYPLSLVLGTEQDTYLSFRFIACDLGTIPAVEYAASRNIVARVNLPNMHYEQGQRVQLYLQAQEGLAELEPDPHKREKYIDFIAEYANLDEEEQTQYEQHLEQSAYKEEIMGPVQQAREEGIQQGIQQGIQLGVELKFGQQGLTLISDIKKIRDLKLLQSIHDGLKSVNSMEELQALYRDYLSTLDTSGEKH